MGTEPSGVEWVFFESLRAEGRDFRLSGDRSPAGEIGEEGRVWFEIEDRKVRWAGMKGWEVRRGRRQTFASEPTNGSGP